MEYAKNVESSGDDLYDDIDDMYISQSDSDPLYQLDSTPITSQNLLDASKTQTTVQDDTMCNTQADNVADLDLYDDLIVEDGQQKIESYQEMVKKFEGAMSMISRLESENEVLRVSINKHEKTSKAVQRNFSSLLVTAKGELNRKEREISELRKKVSNNTGSHGRYRNARAAATETSSFTSIDSNFEPLCVSSPGRQKTNSPSKRSNIITSPVKRSGISPDVRKRYAGKDRCRHGSNKSAGKDPIERTSNRGDVHKPAIISTQSQSPPTRASKIKDKIRSSDRSRNQHRTIPDSEQNSRYKSVRREITDNEREQNQRKIDRDRNKDKNRETKRDRSAYKGNCISEGRRDPYERIELKRVDDSEKIIDSERVERKDSCAKKIFDLREKLKFNRVRDQTGEVLDEKSQMPIVKPKSMPQLSLASLPNGKAQDRVNVIQLASSHSDISVFTSNKSHSVISEPKDNADRTKRVAKETEKRDNLVAEQDFLQKLKLSIISSESSLKTSKFEHFGSRKEQEEPFSRALICYSDMSCEVSESESITSIDQTMANMANENMFSASRVSSPKAACETFILSGMDTDFYEESCGKFSTSGDVNEVLVLNETTLVNESCNLEVDSQTMNKTLDTSEDKFAILKQMNSKNGDHIHESETKDCDTSSSVDINIDGNCHVGIEDKPYSRMLLSPVNSHSTNSRSTELCDGKTPTEYDLECSINQMNTSAGKDGAMPTSHVEPSAGLIHKLTKYANNDVIDLKTPQLEVIASSIEHDKDKSVEYPVKCLEQTRDDTDDSNVSKKMTAIKLKGAPDTERRRSVRLLLRSESSVSISESKSETDAVFESKMEMNKSEDSEAAGHASSTMETEQNIMSSENISSGTARWLSSEKKKKRIRRCVISETISCVTSVDTSDSVSEVFQIDDSADKENLNVTTKGTETSEETGSSESNLLLKNGICYDKNCKIKMRHLHPKLHKNIENLEAPINKNESMQGIQSLNRELFERISGERNEKDKDIIETVNVNKSGDSEKDFAEIREPTPACVENAVYGISVHKNIQTAKTTIEVSASELDDSSSTDVSGRSHTCSTCSCSSSSESDSEVGDETDGMQKEQTISDRVEYETIMTNDMFQDKHVKESQISVSAIETVGQIVNNAKSVSTELHTDKKHYLIEDLTSKKVNLIAEFSEENELVSSREILTEIYAEKVPSTNSLLENEVLDIDSKISKDAEVCNRAEIDQKIIVNIDQSCSTIMPVHQGTVFEGCKLEKVHPTRAVILKECEEMLNISGLHNLVALENGETNINDSLDDRCCSEKVIFDKTLNRVIDKTENSTGELTEKDVITIGNRKTTKTIVACNREVELNAVIDGSGLENVISLDEKDKKPKDNETHSVDLLKCNSSATGENDVNTKEVFEEDAVKSEKEIIMKNINNKENNAQMLTYVEKGQMPCNKNNIDNSANESEGSFGSNIVSERTDSCISTDDSDISGSDDSSENSYSDGSSYSSSDESGSGSSWESYSSDSYSDEACNDQVTSKKTNFDKEKDVSLDKCRIESLKKVDSEINHFDKAERKNGKTEGAQTLSAAHGKHVEGKDNNCVAMTVEGNISNEEKTCKNDPTGDKDRMEVDVLEGNASRMSLNGNSITVQKSASETMCFMDKSLNNPCMQDFPDKTTVQKSPNKVKYTDSPVKLSADQVKHKDYLVEVSNAREIVENRNAKPICGSTTSMSPNKQFLPGGLKFAENIPKQLPNRSNLLQCLLSCVQKEFAHKEPFIDKSAQDRNKLSEACSEGVCIDAVNCLEKGQVNDSMAAAGMMNETQSIIVASNDESKCSLNTVIVDKSVEHTESQKQSQEMCGDIEDISVDKEYEENILASTLYSSGESEVSGSWSSSHPTDCSTCSSYTGLSTESDSESYVRNETRSLNTVCGKDKSSTDIVAYAKEKTSVTTKNSSSRELITESSNYNDVRKTTETEKDKSLENKDYTVVAEANAILELSPTKSNPYWIEDEIPQFFITEDSSKHKKVKGNNKRTKPLKSPKTEESNSTLAVKFNFSPQNGLNLSPNKTPSTSVVRKTSLGVIKSVELSEAKSDNQLNKQSMKDNMAITDEGSNEVTIILAERLKSHSIGVKEFVGQKRNTRSSRNLLDESTASRDKHNLSTEKKRTNKRCIESKKISNKVKENEKANALSKGQNSVNRNGQISLLKNEESCIENEYECNISVSLDRNGKQKTPLKNRGNSLETKAIDMLTDTQSLRRSPRKKPQNLSVVAQSKNVEIRTPAEKEMTVTKRTSPRKRCSNYEKQSSTKNNMLDMDKYQLKLRCSPDNVKSSKSESKVNSSRSRTKQPEKTATTRHIKHETNETKSKITGSKHGEKEDNKNNFKSKKSVESANVSLEASRITSKTKSNGQSYAKGKISVFEKGHFRDTTKEFSDKIMKLKVEQNTLKTTLEKRQMEEKESLKMRISLPKAFDLKCNKNTKENKLKGKAAISCSGTNKQLKVAFAANGHQRIRSQRVASKTGSLNKMETKTFEEKLIDCEGCIAKSKSVQKVSKQCTKVLPVSLSVETTTLKTYTIPKLSVDRKEIREKTKTNKNIPSNRSESSVSRNSSSHEVCSNERKRCIEIENKCSRKNGKSGSTSIVGKIYRDSTKFSKHSSSNDSDLGAASADIESESEYSVAEDTDRLVKTIFGSSDSSGSNKKSITLADLRKTRCSEDTDDVVKDNLLDDKVSLLCSRDLTGLIDVDNKAIEQQRQEANKPGKVKDKQKQKNRKYGVQDNSSENNKIGDKGRKYVSKIVNVNSRIDSLRHNEKEENLHTSDNDLLRQEASKHGKLKDKQKLKARKYVASVQDNSSENNKFGDEERSYASNIVNVDLKNDSLKQNDEEKNLETSDNYLCQKYHLSRPDNSDKTENRKSVTSSRKSSRIKVLESSTKGSSCTNKNGNKSSDSKDGANTNKILRGSSRTPVKSESLRSEEVRYFEISDKNPFLSNIVSPKKPNSNHCNGDNYNYDVVEHNVVKECDAIDVKKPIQLEATRVPIILLEENTMDGIDYDDDMSLDIGIVTRRRPEDSNIELAENKLGNKVVNNASSKKEKATDECIEEGQLSDTDADSETDKSMHRKARVPYQMCNEMTPKKTKLTTDSLVNDIHKFSPIQFPYSPDLKSSSGEDSSGKFDNRRLHEFSDRKQRKRYRNDSDTCSDISTPRRKRQRVIREFSSERKQRRSTERSNSPRMVRRGKTDRRSLIHARRRTPSPRQRTRISDSNSRHRCRHRSRSKSSPNRERRRRGSERHRQVERGRNKYRNYSDTDSPRQHRRKRYCSDERSPSVESNHQGRRHRSHRDSDHRYNPNSSTTKIPNAKKKSQRYEVDYDSSSSDCNRSKERKVISRSQSRQDESSDTENQRFSKRQSEKSRTIETDSKHNENSPRLSFRGRLRNSDRKQTRGNSSYTFGESSRSRFRSHERKCKRNRSESGSDVESDVAEIVGSRHGKKIYKHKQSERDSPAQKRSRVDQSDAKSKRKER